MRGVALIALCGCNAIFGLHDTDVQALEAPPPPPMCPSPGVVPMFSQAPVALFSLNCPGYVVDEAHDFAVADCCPHILQGPADSNALVSATMPGSNDCNTSWTNPRLDPEGTGAIVVDVAGSTFQFLRYDGTQWTKSGQILPFTLATYDFVGAPSRWSSGPHVIARNFLSGAFDEFASSDGTTWSAASPITSLAFTGSTKTGASLSPDGLRMVFIGIIGVNGAAHIYYTDRPTITSQFRAAVELPITLASTQSSNPYLTEDCGALYFADDVGTIWVVRQ